MLTRFLESRVEGAYVLLRVIAGVMFAFAGIQKLFHLFMPPDFVLEVGSQVWIGAIIELVTGICITLGLFTRYAAFLASGTMAVAYAQFHWKFAFDQGFFPAVNQGGPALLNSVLFFYFACRGGGKWSIDAMTKKMPADAV
jgi:putative oxidoreductase